MIYYTWCILYVTSRGGEDITRLAEARRARGFTQEQLAAASGVHRVTIARLETGAVAPNLKTLERLAVALGVSIDRLIEKRVM